MGKCGVEQVLSSTKGALSAPPFGMSEAGDPMPPRRTTTERGYGSEHQAERARLKPEVERGEAYCAELVCLEERAGRSRWIRPGSTWHLAHGAGQQGYRGPAHARCNLAEAARRKHASRRRWIF